MRQAILTRRIPATCHRGERIKATAGAGSIVVAWDYSLDLGGNHRHAAMELARKLGWELNMAGGELPDGKGYVFVDAESVLSPRVSGATRNTRGRAISPSAMSRSSSTRSTKWR